MFSLPKLRIALIALTLVVVARSQTLTAERLVNLSSRGRVTAAGQDLVAGFVIGGSQPKAVLLRGVGPGLAAFGIADACPQVRLRLFDGQGRVLREVTGWGGDTSLAGVFARVGAFPLTVGSSDAALVTTLAPGSYTLQVSALAGGGSVLAEIFDASVSPAAEPQRLINISARGSVQPGDGVLIGGFVITGSAPKKVLIRGVGPTLSAFSVAGALADPRLALYSGSTVIAQNDDWGTPQTVGSGQTAATVAEVAATAQAVGAFTLAAGSKDAAIVVTLAPGGYTAQVAGSTTGAALVEIYEVP